MNANHPESLCNQRPVSLTSLELEVGQGRKANLSALPDPEASYAAMKSYADLLNHYSYAYPFGLKAQGRGARVPFRLSSRDAFVPRLAYMLDRQRAVNDGTRPEWKTAGFKWSRAVAVEGIEGLAHFDSWKWWKNSNPDIAQAVLELVDIWHFALSWLMCRFEIFDGNDETLQQAVMLRIVKALHAVSLRPDSDFTAEGMNQAWERLSGNAALGLKFDMEAFFLLCAGLGVSLDDLFKRYVLKGTLHNFRQRHGYKEGLYLKQWSTGREDNEHLEELFRIATEKLDFTQPMAMFEFEQVIEQGLVSRYAQACDGLHYYQELGAAGGIGHPVGESQFQLMDGKGIVDLDERTSCVRKMPYSRK